MTAENKQVAMYVGGAILVGAVGYFVYSFFQKPVVSLPLGDTTITVGEDTTKEPSLATPSIVPSNSVSTADSLFTTGETFAPIQKPSLLTGTFDYKKYL
jgi:hypothetical protein